MFEKAKLLSTLIVGSSLLTGGCAPTFESHIDAPAAIPISDWQPSPTYCTSTEKKEKGISQLDPRPLLPDANQSPCPLGSGLAACFTLDQDIVRQQRFKIVHDDRDYCRDAYERAVKRDAE